MRHGHKYYLMVLSSQTHRWNNLSFNLIELQTSSTQIFFVSSERENRPAVIYTRESAISKWSEEGWVHDEGETIHATIAANARCGRAWDNLLTDDRSRRIASQHRSTSSTVDLLIRSIARKWHFIFRTTAALLFTGQFRIRRATPFVWLITPMCFLIGVSLNR